MNPFKILSEVKDLYNVLEDGDDSKALIRFVASLTECYTDGKIDLDILMKKLGDADATELAAYVKQGQLIVDHARLVAEAVGEK
jgi:hypothetical protein